MNLDGAADVNRFCALLDVMGMSAWVHEVSPKLVAEKIHNAFDESIRAVDSAFGLFIGESDEPSTYVSLPPHPRPGIALFSDTLLLYSADDTWDSFYSIVQCVREIVLTFFERGIPLSGAMSVGTLFVHAESGTYVGVPLAQAHDEDKKFREQTTPPGGGMCVILTPALVCQLNTALPTQPSWMNGHFPSAVLQHAAACAEHLAWYGNRLCINFWTPAYSALWSHRPQEVVSRVNARFFARRLSSDGETRVRAKFDSTIAFLECCAKERHLRNPFAEDLRLSGLTDASPELSEEELALRDERFKARTGERMRREIAEQLAGFERLKQLGLRDGRSTPKMGAPSILPRKE